MRYASYTRRGVASLSVVVLLVLTSSGGLAQVVTNAADRDAWVTRIRAEALSDSSQVMTYAFYLSDVYGPRFSASPGFRAAQIGRAINSRNWAYKASVSNP